MVEDLEVYQGFMGWSADQLAEALGVARGTWWSWKARGAVPTSKQAELAARLPMGTVEALSEWAEGIRRERERMAVGR